MLQILPNDSTRVRLREVPASEGADYINANHLTYAVGANSHAYIAAQAPLPHTTAEFWYVVW
jgi:protein tyrosine phosphatase